MAHEAEGAHVGKVALAAAFHDGDNVVGVPQVMAAAPVLFELSTGGPVEFALGLPQGFGVEAALRADAAIAREDPLAEIAGVGAQLPLIDAGVAAKGAATLGDRGAAPAAVALRPLYPAARHDAAVTHTRSS